MYYVLGDNIVRTPWRHGGCISKDTTHSIMHANEVERHKQEMKLNSVQRSILVGTLLGDGHLEKQDRSQTYRLKIEHAIGQREYVDWLYSEFKRLVGTPPQLKKRIDRSDSYHFATYSLGTFRFYAQQFYRGKKKVVPRLIRKLLDPLALAVWFMDDGSWKSDRHRTYIFHTLGFDKKDQELLKSALEKKFGVGSNLHKQKTKWRLYIRSDSASRFKEIISPYVRTSFQYKLRNIMPKE